MNGKQKIVAVLTMAALGLACYYRPWLTPWTDLIASDLRFVPWGESVPEAWTFASVFFQLELGMILAAGITAWLSFREPAGTDLQYVAVVVSGFCVFGSFVLPPITTPARYDYQIASAIGQERYDKVFGEETSRTLFCETINPRLRINYRSLAIQCLGILAIGSVVYTLASPPRPQGTGDKLAQLQPGRHSL